MKVSFWVELVLGGAPTRYPGSDERLIKMALKNLRPFYWKSSMIFDQNNLGLDFETEIIGQQPN